MLLFTPYALRNPTSKAFNRSKHHLLVRVVDQLNGVGRALAGARAASLALRRIDVRCAAETADTVSPFLPDHLRDGERTHPRAGEAADAFIRIDPGDNAAQGHRLLRGQRPG